MADERDSQDEGARPAARRAPLSQIAEHEYLHPSPERQAELSEHINRYYNAPLDMFPYSETARKPGRFYDFYEQSIAERFPDDEDVRSLVSRYGRAFFGALTAYVAAKRFLFALALAGLWLIAVEGPVLGRSLGLAGAAATAAAGAVMLLVYPLFAGINALIFMQYRISLENRSYELSRQIIQRTRELQNLYATLRAAPDQEETRYQSEGDAWGARSKFLVRMLMWVASRMEYLEKFIQVEMWRVRRERYWVNWAGGALVVLILVGWAVGFLLQPVPAGGGGGFRALQTVGVIVALLLAWSSYHFWKTPLNLARDKLGAESWVRYATLDVDDTIGDQVSRDKNRLVEYRTLNKGR